MKSLLILLTLVSSIANADMYFECKKVSESEPVNKVSSAPSEIELDATDTYYLRIGKKKIEFDIVDGTKYYSPVLQVESMFLGESAVATYYFNGKKCDSEQTGSLKRVAQISGSNSVETADYECECGED